MDVRSVSSVCAARFTVLLALSLAACQGPTIYQDQTKSEMEDVLRSIAAQQVKERVSQVRALLAQINLAKDQLAAGESVPTREMQPLVDRIAALMELSPEDRQGRAILVSFADLNVRKPRDARKTEYHDVLAWLDRRRTPLRDTLVSRLREKTTVTDKGLLVCVDGVQRHYEKAGNGQFSRLSEKPANC